jgi:O-antigen ligase
LLTTFSLTCVGVILYLYADALRVILYFHMPLSSLFSHSFVNQHFSAPLDMHATYLSLYAGLCLCYCLTRGLRTRNAVARPPRRRSPWFFVAALILAIGLVQLSSKSVWVGMILVGTLAAPYCLSSGRQRLRAFIGSLALVSALGAFLLSGPFFQQRMIADFNRDMVADPTQNVGNEPRMVRWVAAWSMIKASPVLGYGSGSEKPVMEDAYFTQALYEPFLLGLNVHNQFLSWWLKTGLPGLLVYIGMLGWGFYAAVRAKDLVWICFVVLVTMVSLAENILDVQHGLFFFAFFFSFFFFAHRPSTPRWYHGS